MQCFRARVRILIAPRRVLTIIIGRSSRASSWRERAPSRTGWVSKHSQKDVDSSGKAQAPIGPVATGLWLMNVTY